MAKDNINVFHYLMKNLCFNNFQVLLAVLAPLVRQVLKAQEVNTMSFISLFMHVMYNNSITYNIYTHNDILNFVLHNESYMVLPYFGFNPALTLFCSEEVTDVFQKIHFSHYQPDCSHCGYIT